MYNLFLDDLRNPRNVKWVELPLVDWEIVRSYDAFVAIIQEKGIPHRISFDHDLADEHYKEFAAKNNEEATKRDIDYKQFKEKTGYDCAKWLAKYCVDNNIPIPEYYIHSLNGIGLANIVSILESARKCVTI
jgi:hypothetical protein